MSKTMHFTVAAHNIARTGLPTIAILINSVAISAMIGVTGIMRMKELGAQGIDWQTPLREASAQLRDAKEMVLTAKNEIGQVQNDAEEAVDVSPVVANLLGAGYLQPESPVVDLLMSRGLEATFTQLDKLIDEAEQHLVFMEDVVATGVNSDYLAYTQPTQLAVDKMRSFAAALQVIVDATWCAYQGQPSFVPADKAPVAQASQRREAVAA